MILCCIVVLFLTTVSLAGRLPYTLTDLGLPPGAVSVIGVRMNNAGDVAGWSSFSEAPFLRGWVWTQEGGFTVLPPPPGFTRYRAMDISNTGIVSGDGGFDSGLAWRYQNGVYTVIGTVDDLPISYLGGINDAGDIAGTGKDAQFGTPDRAFLDLSGGALNNLTTEFSSRATDVNNAGQVAGYSNSGGFGAFRWDETGGFQFLGSLGLAFSFANAINESGQVVGEALSATGNTSKPWRYTDEAGMQEIPAPVTQSSAAIGINSQGHVVGTTEVGGPDLGWLWTGGSSVTDLDDLYNVGIENISTLAAHDINDTGQILALGYDNNVGEFRTVLLTPPVPPDVTNLAVADFATVAGSITAGSYLDTHTPDGVPEELTEELSNGGNPAKLRSSLEHIWSFDLVAGMSYKFFVDAHRTVNFEGDDFVFSYSLDDSSYTEMLTVTSTVDDDLLLVFNFPEDTAGTMFVKVEDTDRSQGNGGLDTLFIDEMFIGITFDPGVTPPAGRLPDSWAAGTPLTIGHAPGGDIMLNWGASCQASDVDFAVYEGPVGSFASHTPVLCSTAGLNSLTLTPSTGDSYYLVVPGNSSWEGSHGSNGAGAERSQGPAACLPQLLAGCP